ncbi:STAS domain-containing protein [Streptomyces sp. NPDC015345]|uniref:STAS domain-containing protein n=1 Tax=Streptomyces sp. NPDC015345 TaxID=3364953 RepID=UPI0037013DCE
MTHSLHLTAQRPHAHLIIVTVIGNIDVQTAATMRTQTLEIMQEGPPHVVLDLAQVGFCDSSGLSALIGIWHAAREAGGSLGLADVPDRLMRMLAITGIDSLLTIHATAADAVTAMTDGQAAPSGS